MGQPARRFGLGLVLVCLCSTLLVGLAVKAPCASGDWADGKQYRRLCYSDIVPLLLTEQLSTGDRLPYLDPCRTDEESHCDEYPVLTMYTMRLGAWLAPASTASPEGVATRSIAGFFYANAGLLAVAAVVTTVCLYLMVGRRALWFALAPTLAVYGFMNWDLLAVALATAATLAYLNRRDVASGVLIGLGAAAKLYPALLLIPFVLGRFHERDPDRGIHLAWSAAGTYIALNLPFALASPGSWWEFFRLNAERPADWDSLWFIGCHRLTGNLFCQNTPLVNLASMLAFAGASVALWRLRGTRAPEFPRWTFGFPLLLVFLLTNKVYSPQYGLWLLPWFALGLPNLRLFAAFELADVAVFVTRFSWFGRLGRLGGLPIGAFQIAVLVRAAILIWCLVSWVRGSRRGGVLPLPEDAERAGAPA
ncbi:MAG: glycosyltransferase family 87 protein [Actinomycetota bacterium]